MTATPLPSTLTSDSTCGCGTRRSGFLGIDTPELRGEERPEGLVAASRLRDLIENREVTLQSHRDKAGKYGRWLGTIYLDGVSMNQLLLDEGLAEPYPKD